MKKKEMWIFTDRSEGEVFPSKAAAIKAATAWANDKGCEIQEVSKVVCLVKSQNTVVVEDV